MKYLNLSTFLCDEGRQKEENVISFTFSTFKGGEPNIRIEPFDTNTPVEINIRVQEFNDIGKLLVSVDALREMGVQHIGLFMPYFPGARQDRYCNRGEALTVKVYADIINSMGFVNVTILDPHSDVTPALINNCRVIDNHDFVKACMSLIYDNDSNYGNANSHIISPDAGANKKSLALIQSFEHPSLIKCDKVRNLSDGKLTGFTVYADDLEGKDCVIVDDICDGGGTFIGLAEKLKEKNSGDLYLIVSHGIFSKGTQSLDKLFKGIYTTDSFTPVYEDETTWNNSIKIEI